MLIPDLMHTETSSPSERGKIAVKLQRSALLVGRALCFICLCWLIARFIVTMQLTLGVVLYNLALIGLVLSILAFIQLALNDRSLLSLSQQVRLSWRKALAVVLISLFVGTLMLCIGDRLISIPDVVLAIGAVMLVSTSMVLMARGRAVDAICLNILSWPMIIYESQDWAVLKRLYFELSGEIFGVFGWLIVGLILIGWMSRVLRRQESVLRSLGLAPLILLVAGAVCAASAPFPERSWISYVHVTVMPVLIYFFLTASVQSWDDVKKLFGAAGVSVGLLAAVGLYFALYRYREASEFLMGMQLTEGGAIREAGNPFSEIGPVTFPVVLALLATASRNLHRVLWGGLGLLILATEILTFNRANGVAMVVSMLPWLIASRRGRWAGVIVSMGVISLIWWVPEGTGRFFARFESLTSWTGFQQEERYKIWGAAIQMFLDHPWTGLGVGMWPKFAASYGLVFSRYIDGTYMVYVSPWAHSAFLQVMAEMGIVGLIAWAMIFWSLIHGTLRLTRAPQRNWRWFALAMQSIALVLTYHLFIGRFPYYEVEQPIMVLDWLWFAVIMAGRRFPKEDDLSQPKCSKVT